MLVLTLKGIGWTQEDIALRMGCDVKTLRKHFSRELDSGRLMLESLSIQVLVHKMMQGHVGAAQKVYEIARVRPASPVKLGKKELAKLDAAKAPAAVDELLERTQRLH